MTVRTPTGSIQRSPEFYELLDDLGWDRHLVVLNRVYGKGCTTTSEEYEHVYTEIADELFPRAQKRRKQ